ncbi:hypothetical protein ACLOJK_004721, partial [Asimina triloba]
ICTVRAVEAIDCDSFSISGHPSSSIMAAFANPTVIQHGNDPIHLSSNSTMIRQHNGETRLLLLFKQWCWSSFFLYPTSHVNHQRLFSMVAIEWVA